MDSTFATGECCEWSAREDKGAVDCAADLHIYIYIERERERGAVDCAADLQRTQCLQKNAVLAQQNALYVQQRSACPAEDSACAAECIACAAECSAFAGQCLFSKFQRL